LLGKIVAYGGQPQEEDKCKKVDDKRLMKGPWEFPWKHHWWGNIKEDVGNQKMYKSVHACVT